MKQESLHLEFKQFSTNFLILNQIYISRGDVVCQTYTYAHDKNESVWTSLIGAGWKSVANSVVEERTKALNTPKPGPVRELFRSVIGTDDVTSDWCWAKNDRNRVLERLSSFVSLRGSIAHGEQLAETVTKARLAKERELIVRIVERVEMRVF